MRFNGALAAELTGLTGKPLGELMARIRKSFPDEAALESFFIEADMDEIRTRYLDAAADAGKNE
jgi:coproporphyrinogen III oxidase-like Fe-S oxidoreductase